MIKLFLNNFRAFKKETFQFSRINILIGENSSGKSSVFKFLLALKQSLNNSTETNLSLSGSLVDLGSYKEIINYQQTRKKLSFAFSAKDDYNEYFLDYLSIDEESLPANTRSLKNHFKNAFEEETVFHSELNKDLDKHENIKTTITNKALGTLVIEQIKPTNLLKGVFTSVAPVCHIVYYMSNGIVIRAENIRFDKEAFFSLIYGKDLKEVILANYDESIYNEITFFLIFQNFLIDFLEKIQFISSAKNIPERYYLQRDKKRLVRANDIQSIVNLIGDNDVPKVVLDKFIKVIHELGIAEDIKVIKAENIAVRELRVKVSDLFSNITDVGYGVGLQLPILFQACVSELINEGQIILIEQPEVHLHPSLQAKFIDALLSIGPKNTYFIETHSEHIIRKLQILVKTKEKHLSSDDISISYLKKGDKKTDKTDHKIMPDGTLDLPFPSGFFDISYQLAKKLVFTLEK